MTVPAAREQSIPAAAVLRPRPNAASVELLDLSFRAASAEVKSVIADLDVPSRRVADARKGFASNDSLALFKPLVVPELK